MNSPSRADRGRLWAELIVTALALAGAEVFSRRVLGLGAPPLYEADADYEYRLRPNQDVRRFGNRVFVNRWGMRADDFGPRKTSADELRVVAVGDSIVNGGSTIDHRQLATTLLKQDLQAAMQRPVTVGNVSAGSWGPGNWLACARRHGFFDADVVRLVFGSGDYVDNPTFAPLGVDHPTAAPWSALQEAFVRYLPRFVPPWLHARGAPSAPEPASPAEVARGLADLEAFLALALADSRKVVAMHHPDRDELLGGRYMDGFTDISALLRRLGIDLVDLAPVYRTVSADVVYRDKVHHIAFGQRLLAQALQAAVRRALAASPAEAPSTP